MQYHIKFYFNTKKLNFSVLKVSFAMLNINILVILKFCSYVLHEHMHCFPEFKALIVYKSYAAKKKHSLNTLKY